MRNNAIQTLFLALVTSLLAVSLAQAESTPQEDRQQLEQMLEMMKNSGIDPSQIQHVEAMIRGLAETEIQRKEQKVDTERSEFLDTFGSESNATVDVNGRQYDLFVTTCKWLDESLGTFAISAEQPAGSEGATLHVSGGGSRTASYVNFSTPTGSSDPQPEKLDFDGEAFAWTGVTDSLDRGKLIVEVKVRCP